RKAILQWKPDVTLIMDVTPVETALCFRTLPGPIAFLLFVQYPEIPRVGRYRVKRWVKKWKTRLWLARQHVRAVFLLNGERACDYLNCIFPRTPVFQPVPEPLDSYPEDRSMQLRQVYAVPDDAVIFLYPGILSRRKGLDELLGALRGLSPAAAARAFFLFAGHAEAADHNRLIRGLSELHHIRPDIRLVHEDEFLPAGRLQAWMRQANWILLPYRRSDYSSGILGRAAEAGTPVLGPDDGLIGHLIRRYGLGVCAPISAMGLCAGIEDALTGTFQPNADGQRAYVARSKPEEFARIVIQGSVNPPKAGLT
ncbi:MAG: glycosyltransferase, partial [Kiritimatiellae bacterium]|nr:glycosyltransferase [Kiritimatiellia bacterium]